MKNQPQNSDMSLKNDIHANDIEAHLRHISQEFEDGFKILRKYPKTVTMFGSSMMKPESPIYPKAIELASRISKDTGYTVLTGGGLGLMEAFNKGAFESGGQSVGFNISLPHDRDTNQYLTDKTKFSYFFIRKAMMTFTAEAFIYLPGGFGTLDELFSVLTLMQTDKIPHVPVILFDSSYWNNLAVLIKDIMVEKYGTVKEKDLGLFKVTDSIDEVVNIIKSAPTSEWWRNLN